MATCGWLVMQPLIFIFDIGVCIYNNNDNNKLSKQQQVQQRKKETLISQVRKSLNKKYNTE